MTAADPEPQPPDDAPVQSRQALTGAFLVIGAATLWATFGLFAKQLYALGFGAAELASVRAFVAFVAVLPFALLRRTPLRMSTRDALFLTFYGVVGFAVFEVIFLAALGAAPVSVAAALLYTAPAFVVLLARFTLGEPVNAGRLAALGLVLAGVLLVTGAVRMIGGGAATLSARGLWLGLAAGFSYAVYTVLSKAAMQRVPPLPALVWSFGAASLALAFVAPPIEPLMRRADALPWLIALGLVPTLFAYALFLRALRFLRAGAASMIASIEPVVAALLAVLLLGETLHMDQVAGIACIVAAAVLTERQSERG